MKHKDATIAAWGKQLTSKQAREQHRIWQIACRPRISTNPARNKINNIASSTQEQLGWNTALRLELGASNWHRNRSSTEPDKLLADSGSAPILHEIKLITLLQAHTSVLGWNKKTLRLVVGTNNWHGDGSSTEPENIPAARRTFNPQHIQFARIGKLWKIDTLQQHQFMLRIHFFSLGQKNHDGQHVSLSARCCLFQVYSVRNRQARSRLALLRVLTSHPSIIQQWPLLTQFYGTLSELPLLMFLVKKNPKLEALFSTGCPRPTWTMNSHSHWGAPKQNISPIGTFDKFR